MEVDQSPQNISIRDIQLHLYEKVETFKSETEILDFIDEIPEGSLLFDLGSCGGTFSLYAASKGIRSWAFEPNSHNHQLLLENISRNPHCASHIVPLKLAVGDGLRQEDMIVMSPKKGGHNKMLVSSSRQDLHKRGTNFEPVTVIALDNFGIVPDYMKIDVDGSEVNFIKGAVQTLRNPKLKAIVFELNIADPGFSGIEWELHEVCGFREESRHLIDNNLYNIIYRKL